MTGAGEVRLRPATVADIPLLRAWDAEGDVVAATGADGDFDWDHEVPRSVSWREILIGEVDDRPVGVLVIIDAREEETHYWGDVPPGLWATDIWIGAAADRGRGFGARMMQLALARCFADPAVAAMLVDPLAANTRARRFYERLGFRAVGPRRFGEDDCVVYRIDRGEGALPG